MAGSKKIAGGCLYLLYVAAIVLFSISIKVIPVNEVALKFNTINIKYDSENVYFPGRYLSGLGNSFETFPTTWQRMNFCREVCENGLIQGKAAKEGSSPVRVSVSLTVFYKIKLTRLPELIQKFPRKDYHTDYVSKTKTAISEAIQDLDITELISQRSKVERIFGLAINKEMQKVMGYVVAVYLGDVALDETSNDSFLQQWISNQHRETEKVQGKEQEILERTKAVESEENKKKDILLAEQNRFGSSYIASKSAEGDEEVLKAEGRGYQLVRADLNFTNDQILKFIYYQWLKKPNNPQLNVFAGFQDENKFVDLR